MSSWLQITPSQKSSLVNFFLFHHAGGSAFSYARLEQELPKHWGLILIELPGRGSLWDHPIPPWKEIGNHLATEIKPHLNKPSLFFGHSMGALVAYETLKLFDETDFTHPSLFITSAMKAPHWMNAHEQKLKVSLLNEEDLLEHLEKLQGIPDELKGNEFAKRFFLPIIRKDFALIETYQSSSTPSEPTFKLPLPICAYSPSQDPLASLQQMMDWQNYTQKDFKLRAIEGGHFYHFKDFKKLIEMILDDYS